MELEVKRGEKFNKEWAKSLRALAALEGIKVERLILVYTGQRSYRFGPRKVMPAASFFQALHRGEIF